MAENDAAQVQYVPARLTFTDMNRADLFSQTHVADGWGVARAPFSPQLARMSAELAANVYDLDLAQWTRAGWMDCTFVVEERVVALDRDSDSKLAAIEAEWKRRRAKSLIHGLRPIGDLMRAMRQFLVTDMGKSVVMTRLNPDGRVVVAISFIGTTQKFFDWFSNFKVRSDGGMHYGFLELARQFDAQASRVQLPALAAALGRETLTLADALGEARQPDGKFTFWLSGHSQGGALVQTYTHLLLERGVRPGSILGYSFAAPTVTACGGVETPSAYPIYNIVNADDMVTRVGAHARLGVDCVFFPTDAFRDAHYRINEEERPVYERMRYLAAQVQTTADAYTLGITLTRMMRRMQSDEAVAALFMVLIPHMSKLRRVGIDMGDIAQYLETKLLSYLKELTGAEPSDARCARFEETLLIASAEFGAKKAARALARCLKAPHGICPDKRDEGHVPPYIAIVRKHLGELEHGAWQPDAPPRCVSAKGTLLLPKQTMIYSRDG